MTGTGPSSVLSQTGQLARIVEWVAAAYEDIQNMHTNWDFLHESFDFQTIANQAEYTPTGAGVNDLQNWDKTDFRIYLQVSDEYYLDFSPWSIFRPAYQFGTLRTQVDKPIAITYKPNKNLFLWPIPDVSGYTVDGQYFKQPDIMEEDADVPVFATNYHLAIVWRGLMFYGADLGAPDVYAHGQKEYKKVLRKMEQVYLPDPFYGAPLA